MTAFKPATRTAIKIKLAISGPSGSGKTMGALALAKGLGKKIALIDTENGSASSYAGRQAFDVLELGPPFTSKRYQEAIDAAVEAGYDVLIIDSLSHQWTGDGGILSRKEEMDRRPNSNSYTNWATFTKEHNAFIADVLHAPIHIVATIRAKQDYVLTEKNGKQVPVKVGMAPVQREGLEYEFSTVFELQMDHRAAVSKDRTNLFGGEGDKLWDLTDPGVSAAIRGWLDSAKPAPVAEPADLLPVSVKYPLPGKPTAWGGHGGKQLGELPTSLLGSVLTWADEQSGTEGGYRKAGELAAHVQRVLDARDAGRLAEPERNGKSDDELPELLREEDEATESDPTDAGQSAPSLPLGDRARGRGKDAVREGR
jgi:hypothetical protein